MSGDLQFAIEASVLTGLSVGIGATVVYRWGDLKRWWVDRKRWRLAPPGVSRAAWAQGRTRRRRQAVYEAATEARRRAVQTRMVNRQDARARWESAFVEAGASVHELKPGFTRWTGEQRQIGFVGRESRLTTYTVPVGSFTAPLYGEQGHTFLVGPEADHIEHFPHWCDKCQQRRREHRVSETTQKPQTTTVEATIYSDGGFVEHVVIDPGWHG